MLNNPSNQIVAFFFKLVVFLMPEEMPDAKIPVNESRTSSLGERREKVKLEVYGEEMVEKVVKLSGNSGRVYLPPDWVGCRVKIIRLD
jgi:putative transposon-encoded protein